MNENAPIPDNQQAPIKDFKSDWFLQLLTTDKFRLYRHIVAVSVFFLLTYLMKQKGDYIGIVDSLDWMVNSLIFIALFYLNLYVLVPKTLFKGHSVWYFMSLIGVIALGGLLLLVFPLFVWRPYRVVPMAGDEPIFAFFLVLIVLLLFLVLSSTFLKFFQHLAKNAERMQAIEQQAFKSELQALRSQIHPHFLFNMLNNINVLIRHDPEKASHIVVKLSDFLRHLLYETDQEAVYLSSEIRFLADYLSLEKMRRDDFSYELIFDEAELQGVKIPPNILLILVENAVKHSADAIDASYVYLSFYIQEGYVFFVGRNSISSHPHTNKKASGIGLPNIQRRLELLYEDHFQLISEQIKNEYVVTLKLPL